MCSLTLNVRMHSPSSPNGACLSRATLRTVGFWARPQVQGPLPVPPPTKSRVWEGFYKRKTSGQNKPPPQTARQNLLNNIFFF